VKRKREERLRSFLFFPETRKSAHGPQGETGAETTPMLSQSGVKGLEKKDPSEIIYIFRQDQITKRVVAQTGLLY